jgi:transcriptional regulator with XRE-family HTH domain
VSDLQAIFYSLYYKLVFIVDIHLEFVYNKPYEAPMNNPDLFYKKIGENIRAKRKERGFSQEVLAKAVGLKRPSLSNIEKGRQNLLLHTFCNIADTLGTSLEVLLPERVIVNEEREQPDLSSLSKVIREFVEAAINPVMEEKRHGNPQTKD